MLKKLKTTSQRGDTIVEVMIVLAVLGLALSISYATANRSLLNARQAQENSEATEIVQSQVEALRDLAGVKNPPQAQDVFHPSHSTGFCIDRSTTPYTLVPTTNASPNAACHVSTYYDTLILYCGTGNGNSLCNGLTGPGSDTFLVRAEWDDVRGDAKDTTQIVYRVHAP